MILTIVSITKDDFKGILRTIKSTRSLRENFGVKQVIVDGSSLKTSKKLQLLARKEKNVLYFWKKPQGIANAFNFGINKAPVSWIWFLNGGDKVSSRLDSNFFFSALNNVSSKVIIFSASRGEKTFLFPPLYAIWPPIFLNWIPHAGVIVQRDLLIKIGAFDETYSIATDGELWVRLLSKNVPISLISYVIASYDSPGLSSNLKKRSKEVFRIALKYKFVILKRFLNLIYINIKMILKSLKYILSK